MKTFRIHAESIEFMYIDIEAETREEAVKMAQDTDGNEWKSNNEYDWEYNWSLTEEIKEK